MTTSTLSSRRPRLDHRRVDRPSEHVPRGGLRWPRRPGPGRDRKQLGGGIFGFGLVLLPTLTFVGFVTFERTLQTSLEDTEYARRIALLRTYYFEHAPEIASYLVSVPPAERLHMQRVPGDRWQGFRTVAGMIAVLTAVLAGSTAALAAILIFDHSLAAAVISGAVVALPVMIAMIRHQDSAWQRAAAEPLTQGED